MMSFAPILFLLLPFLLPSQPVVQPTAPQAMYGHIPKQCQLVIGIDTSTLLPHLFSAANKLGNHPIVQKNPRMKMMLMRGLMMVNMQRQRLQKEMGQDPIKAIKSITMGVSFRTKMRRERLIFAIGGNFVPGQFVSQLGKIIGIPTNMQKQVGAFTYIKVRRGPSFGWFSKGPIFMAKERDMLFFLKNGGLQGGKPALGSTAALMIAKHQTNALLAVGIQPNNRMKMKALRRTSGIVRRLAKDLTFVHTSLGYKHNSATFGNTDPAVKNQYAELLKGAGMFAVSGDFAMRGMLQIIGSLLDPNDHSLPPFVRQIAQHKQSLFSVLFKHIGSKSLTYKVTQNNNSAKLATQGNSGFGVLALAAAAGGLFGYLRQSKSAQSRVMPAMPSTVHRHPRFKRSRRPSKMAPTPIPQPASRPATR